MPWYRAGSVAVTNGSATVNGAGTDFVSNVSIGDGFIAPDRGTYEIAQVVSATQLLLATPYQGASAGGQGYSIKPTQSFARDLANGFGNVLNTFGAVRDGIGQGLIPDGTVATPAIRFASDQDTGLARVGADAIALITGGVSRLDVRPTGVGIQNTVGVSGSSPRMTFGSPVAAWQVGCPADQNGLAFTELQFSSEKMRISPNGSVGIGTPGPLAQLHVKGTSTTVRIESTNAGATDTQLAIVSPERQWNIGQNVGGSGQGTLNFFDVTAGALRLSLETNGIVRPGIDNGQGLGAASARWSVVYAGTGSIATSDEREKDDIDAIPDGWLDAWGDVQWCRFRFRDAIAAKGEDARWHLGLIAQQVRDAFAGRGLDAQEIGLLCHDEWDGSPVVEEVQDEEGEIVTPARAAIEAGDRWGLRYDECQAIEAAWQRRRIEQLEVQLAALNGRMSAG